MSKELLEKLPYSTPEADVLEFALERAACIVPGSRVVVNRQDDYGDYQELDEI